MPRTDEIQVASLQTNALFTQYLNVVNRALHEHRTEAPWKQLIDLGEAWVGDEPFAVAVYSKDASAPHDHFQVVLRGDRFELLDHGKGGGGVRWKIPRSHLEQVVSDPQPYVDNPLRLDLDWLEKRLAG